MDKFKVMALAAVTGGLFVIAAPQQRRADMIRSVERDESVRDLPVVFTFDKAEDFNADFTVIDSNADGFTWDFGDSNGNGVANYNLNYFKPADDFLVTPGLNLKNGMIYEVSFDNNRVDYWAPESIEILFGDKPTVEGLSQLIAKIPAYSEVTQMSKRFVSHDDGVRYLALHIYTQESRNVFYVDNLTVKEVAHSLAPGKPGLKVAPADDYGSKVVVSVMAPSENMSGLSNEGNSTIKVYRGDDVTPAHVFTDLKSGEKSEWTDEAPGSGRVLYRAVAENSYGDSEASEDEAFVDGLIPPYSTEFESENEAKYYTVIDHNKDKSTWAYKDGAMVYTYNLFNDADDWLFTPKVRMNPSRVYEVVAKLRTNKYSDNTENLRITLGDDIDPENQTTLLDLPDFNSKEGTSRSAYVMVEEDKCYNIGFYAYSPDSRLYIYLDGVAINDVASSKAPAEVNGLTATPGRSGEQQVTVSFSLPTNDCNGDELISLSAVEIFRGEDQDPVKTFSSPGVGETLEWTDENAPAGNVTYRVCASNSEGRGLHAEASAYVGLDVPSEVGNLKAKGDSTNTNAIVSWSAPQTGVNDGYVNPSSLKYTVTRVVDYTPTVIATDIAETQFFDEYSAQGQQERVSYKVYASNEKGSGAESRVEVWLGKLWNVPVNEQFQSALNSEWQNVTLIGYGQWRKMDSFNEIKSPDGSAGILEFHSWSDNGVRVEGMLQSPKISLNGSVNPWLSISVYHNPDEDARKHFRIGYMVNDGPFVELDDIKINDGELAWKTYSWKIDAMQSDFVSVVLYAECYDNKAGLIFDDLIVDDRLDHNLSIESFSGPSEVRSTESVYKAIVYNKGLQSAGKFDVVLLKDGEIFSSEACEKLPAGESIEIEFTIPAPTAVEGGNTYVYSVRIDYEADMKTADNVSDELEVLIVRSNYPGISDLSGVNMDKGVVLRWSEPSTEYSFPLTEDFCSFEEFAISDLHPWKMFDGDGQYTKPVRFDIPYQSYVSPKAWQVWNPLSLAQPLEGADVAPHSGRQCLISMMGTGSTDTSDQVSSPKTDDWLISEEIVGGSELSFYVMQPVDTYGGNEAFEVLYSSKTDKPEDFEVIASETLSGRAAWTKCQYSLPDDAKYFAIRHHVSYFGLWLDDITYSPTRVMQNLKIDGYNVYRDGEFLQSCDGPSFIDKTPLTGMHTYGVATLFSVGEGPVSNIVEVDTDVTGLDTAEARNEVAIRADNGAIVVSCSETAVCEVFTLSGTIVKSIHVYGSERIPVTAGVYVVRCNDVISKVIIN